MKRLSLRVGAGALVAAALCLSQAPTAWAQAAPTAPTVKVDLNAAKKHYGEGDKKFKAGDFAAAEVEFKAANDIKPAPQTERYIGLCEDSIGHFPLAVEWYEKFLAHVPEKMTTQGEEVKKRVGEIRALPGKVRVESQPEGAALTVDDKPQAAPTPGEVELPPGSHTLKLTAPGRLPTTKVIDVAFASKQTVAVTLDAEPPPPPPPPVAAAPPPPPAPAPPPPPAPRSKVPAYVTGGLAIAAAGVGTAFGIMTLGDKSDFDKHPTTSTADNGDTHALICDMAFGVALTFGVTSAVLFLTKEDVPPATATVKAPEVARADKKPGVTITPTPIVGAHTGGAGVLVRF